MSLCLRVYVYESTFTSLHLRVYVYSQFDILSFDQLKITSIYYQIVELQNVEKNILLG